MMTYLFLRPLASKSVFIVCWAVCLVRAYQFFFSDTAYLPVNYYSIMPIGLTVFVFVPLFALPISHVVSIFTNIGVIVRIKDSISHIFRYCGLVFLIAMVYTLVLNITVFLILAAHGKPVFENSALLATTVVAQIIFFLICALLFYFVHTITRKSYLACIALFCYVVWDYLILFIPARLPAIGWGLTQFSFDYPNYAEALAHCSLLVCVLIVLVLLSALALHRQERLESPGV